VEGRAKNGPPFGTTVRSYPSNLSSTAESALSGSLDQVEIRASLIERRIDRQRSFELAAGFGELSLHRERAPEQIVGQRIALVQRDGLLRGAPAAFDIIEVERKRGEIAVDAAIARVDLQRHLKRRLRVIRAPYRTRACPKVGARSQPWYGSEERREMSLLPVLAVLVQTLGGQSLDALQLPPGTKAIVYIFTSTECPVSNRYAPEIRRLEQTFASRGVRFRLVYPSRFETDAAVRTHLAAFAYGKLEAVRDPTLALVGFTGATITPEVAIIADGRVVYRGRIDDRFVELGVERPKPTVHDLADALTSVVEGRPISRPTTQAVGCYIADLTR
jgi:hypothetical protein